MTGLLLDTHVWIWLMSGNAALSAKHQKIINEAAINSEVAISAISTWEIAMLVMKDRIRLEKPVLNWVQDALALPGIELKPLSPEIAVESTQLPDHFHGDPADRIIVATARIHRLTLLTHDQKMIDYAKKSYVAVLGI